MKGDHYRSVVLFSDEILPLIPENSFGQETNSLRYEFAKSLRMTGDHKRSKALSLELSNASVSKSTLQSTFLNLALCHQSLGEVEEAIAAAEKVLKLGMHGHQALQAQSIIVELNHGDPERAQKLEKLEAQSRRKKAFVVANNIALTRVSEKESPEEAGEILSIVIRDSKDDFYNRVRATIRIAELEFKTERTLSDAHQSSLIEAYHFIFNERLSSLFEKCHRVLWTNFESRSDTANLLSLFRHSSFFWRVRGQEDREREYLSKLAKTASNVLVSADVRTAPRETAYYLVRAGALASQTAQD